MKIKFTFLLVICCLTTSFAFAQGGGPPMLTDDPETPDKGHFEINTSFNTQITNQQQYSLPLIDANFGANERTQLKVQIPFLITNTPPAASEKRKSIANLGYPLVGVKYRFLDQDKDSISVSTYPQILIAGNESELILPVELQRSFGRFTVGEEVGYFFILKKSQNMLEGSLLGYNVSKRAQLLIELYFDYNFNTTVGTDGFINCGFRYAFNKTFTLLASCGTQIINPATEQKQYFFSFLGVQTVF